MSIAKCTFYNHVFILGAKYEYNNDNISTNSHTKFILQPIVDTTLETFSYWTQCRESDNYYLVQATRLVIRPFRRDQPFVVRRSHCYRVSPSHSPAAAGRSRACRITTRAAMASPPVLTPPTAEQYLPRTHTRCCGLRISKSISCTDAGIHYIANSTSFLTWPGLDSCTLFVAVSS